MLFRTGILTIATVLLIGSADLRAEETPVTSLPAAYSLTQADVEAAAAKELVSKGAGARIKAMLTGNASAIVYQSAKSIAPRLTGFNYNHNTSRWTANLLVIAGDEVITAMPVGGRYEEVVLRPVLKRQVRSGETIAQSDIDMLEFPVSLTRNDEVMDPKQLLGMGPRTVISPRRPIRATEIAMPAVVHKSAIVTMHYNNGGVDITTSGQTMSEGRKGEMIEVRNLASKNVVRAIVEDANTVNVSPPSEARVLAGVPYVPAN